MYLASPSQPLLPIRFSGNSFALRPLSPTVTLVSIAAGVFLVGSALHDVFHTLFHPAGRGAMSDYAARVVWKMFRPLAKRNYRTITLAGPAAIVTIMAMWIALVVVGFALIYFPYIQARYVFASGIPDHHRSFLDAINVSLGGLVTLGGDINATTRTLRLLEGIQAVVGFGLLTANVSWLLSLYPVLEKRHTVGHEINLLHNAEMETGINILDLPSQEGQPVLWGLARELAELRNDLVQFPVSYYFHSGDEESGLSAGLPYLAKIAAAASQPDMEASYRVAGVSLGGAIDDYLEEIAEVFLRMPKHDKAAIMRRLAEDQLRQTYTVPSHPRRRVA
jgi:hypothetical protein